MQVVHYSYRLEYENFNPSSSLMLTSNIKIIGIVEHISYRLLNAHSHLEYCHIWYVLAGSVLTIINGKPRYISKNEFIFIPIQTPHGLEATRDSKIFDLKFIAPPNLIPPKNIIYQQPFLFDVYGLSDLIEKILIEIGEKSDGWDSLVTAYSSELITKAMRAYKDGNQKFLKKSTQRDNDFQLNDLVSEIEAFIYGNFMKDISLQELGELFNYNPCYLGTVFKKMRGISIIEALNEVRIKHAQLKLKNKALTIQQIAKEVGYRNHSYFTKLFKEIVGITPTEFRESISK